MVRGDAEGERWFAVGNPAISALLAVSEGHPLMLSTSQALGLGCVGIALATSVRRRFGSPAARASDSAILPSNR
jgi:hypothetical protein